MTRCSSSTEVTLTAGGERVPVLCRLDDSHTHDHEGYFGGMLLHWPLLPTAPLVFKVVKGRSVGQTSVTTLVRAAHVFSAGDIECVTINGVRLPEIKEVSRGRDR